MNVNDIADFVELVSSFVIIAEDRSGQTCGSIRNLTGIPIDVMSKKEAAIRRVHGEIRRA